MNLRQSYLFLSFFPKSQDRVMKIDSLAIL